jgi:deoxyhypusine synthase
MSQEEGGPHLEDFPLVEHLEPEGGMTVRNLVDRMRTLGFNAGKLHRAARIWLDAARDDDARVYLTLAGAMVPAGLRRVVAKAMEAGLVDLLTTTGANVAHDGVEGFMAVHRKAHEHLDDAWLRDLGVLRVYDILVPWREWEEFDKWVEEGFFPGLAAEHASGDGLALVRPTKFLRDLGKWLAEERGDDGVLATAYRQGVPIHCPSLTDCNYGIVLDYANRTTLKEKGFRVAFDQTADFAALVEDMARARERAVVVVGGGSPKNYVFQASETLSEVDYRPLLPTESMGFKYALQVTTDAPHWGGLSGATLREAISWRKVDPHARRVTVYSDATIALPLLVQYVVDELGGV